MFVVAMIGTTPLPVLLAAHAPLAALLVAALLSGMSISFFNLVWFTVVQRKIPGEELSRVVSWDALGSYAISPLGLAAAGPIAVAVGIPATLYGGAVLGVLATVAVLAVRSVRDLTYEAAGASSDGAAERRAV